MKSAIEAKLGHLKNLSFPAWAENDALSDWQTELAEIDAYLAGLALTIVGGGRPDTSMAVDNVRQLRVGLEAIDGLSGDDIDIRTECHAYLVALEDLALSLRR